MTSEIGIQNPTYTKKHVRFETSNHNNISFDCQMPRTSCDKLMTVPSINNHSYKNNFNSSKVPANVYSTANTKPFVGPCKDLELSIYDDGKTNSCTRESLRPYADENCFIAHRKTIAYPPIDNNHWPNLNQINKCAEKVEINKNMQLSTEKIIKKGTAYQDFFINPGESPTSCSNKIPQYKNMALPNVSVKLNENINSRAWKQKKQSVLHAKHMCDSEIKENIPQCFGKMALTGSELCHLQEHHENIKCLPTSYGHKYEGREGDNHDNCCREYYSPSGAATTEKKHNNCAFNHHRCPERQYSSESRRGNIDVEDLVQIIKIQNGQLQMLQEQVTKLMALNDNRNVLSESCNNLQRGTAEILDKQSLLSSQMTQDKMSIGVMTSFEMVRTYSSTIGQHDQAYNNVQCNKSQISITEVISATKQNVNFLDGLKPRSDSNNFQDIPGQKVIHNKVSEMNSAQVDCTQSKLANDLSLADIQIEQLKSPQLSPQASMRLDMQDFSDSDPDEQTAEGWTYYNKVMDRVNDILYTPTSSTSILRNQRSKTVTTAAKTSPKPFQKTLSSDTSTFKRVTFNENVKIDPKPRPKICDTSMKMNELAKKYLQHYDHQDFANEPARPQGAGNNFLFENGRNCMESAANVQNADKFLDLATLRQQPKLF